MLNYISAVSDGQLTLFKIIVFSKFTVTVLLSLYHRLSCDVFDIALIPQIPPLIDSHKQFQNVLFDGIETSESDFSKDLLMLREYESFTDSFLLACRKFKKSEENAKLAKTTGFESEKEYDEIMFLREITHTVNAFNDMGDIVRFYSKNPDAATARLSSLLSEEASESV